MFETTLRKTILNSLPRMNADLQLNHELENTGNGSLFMITGKPDVEILAAEDRQLQQKIKGADISRAHTGKTTLKAEINEGTWSTLNSDTSRPTPHRRAGSQ